MAKYTRSGVFEASLAVFQQWLQVNYAMFGDSALQTAYLRNAADMRSFSDLFKKKQQASDEGPVVGTNTKLVYPFAGLTVGQISPDEHKAGYKPKRFSGGQLIGKDRDKDEAYFESYAPVVVTIGAAIESNDFDDIIAYVTMFIQSRPRITLLLRSEDTGFTTEIGVQPELQFTIPQADSSTPGDPYKFEHTLTISTYMGIAKTMPLIKDVKVTAIVTDNPDKTEFTVDNPTMEFMSLKYFELFDKGSTKFKYAYKQEAG